MSVLQRLIVVGAFSFAVLCHASGAKFRKKAFNRVPGAVDVNRELTGANNEWINPLFFLVHPNQTRGWEPWRVQVSDTENKISRGNYQKYILELQSKIEHICT